jgi:head-tail adaptor
VFKNLDQRIYLLSPVVSYNEYNEPVTTYTTYPAVWAVRQDVSGSEKLQTDEIAASQIVRFTVRWSATVETLDPTWRIQHGSQDFDIVAKRDVGRREYVEIDTTRRTEAAATYDVGSP